MKEESIELQMKTLDAIDDSIVEDYRSLTSVLDTNHGRKKNLKSNYKYVFRIRKCQLRQEKCSKVCYVCMFVCICTYCSLDFMYCSLLVSLFSSELTDIYLIHFPYAFQFAEPLECMVLDPSLKQLQAPTLKVADAISCTLEWEEVSGCEGYRVRYRIDDKDKEEWQEVEALIQNNTVRKKGLKANTLYIFEVKPMGVVDGSTYAYSISSSAISTVNLAPHVLEILPDSIMTHTGYVNANERLGGKVIGFYFSGHWCPPCRKFTEKLIRFYHSSDNKNAKVPMEVVFISCDKSEEEFTKYYEMMPWTAIPYNAPHREDMKAGFQVGGVPRLVIVSPSGQTVCNQATNFNLHAGILETWATDLRL